MKFLIMFSVLSLASLAHAQPAITKSTNSAAAKKVADTDPACTSLGDFYWEIGTKDSVLASGSNGAVNRETSFPIASASKWMFGAYAIEKLQGKIDDVSSKALRMISGYTSMPALSCIMLPTVKACFEKGDNSTFTAANDGHFFYNGAHFQKWGVDHGLGALDRPGLVAEYKKVLGSELPIQFGPLQFAGGVITSAHGYATFLQKILSGKLLIHDHLGEKKVCTLSSACPGDAIRSPVQIAWHYSYAHWVEDDPQGDGSFSSPGAFGFYPWIDSSKTYYGVISRKARARGEAGAGYMSAMCGQKIRKALFNSGK